MALGTGLLLALIFAALWHGPLGGGQTACGAHRARRAATLVYYEMAGVTAHVHRAPLSRRLMLTGPADDFQRSELPRTMDTLPGVSQRTVEPAGGACR